MVLGSTLNTTVIIKPGQPLAWMRFHRLDLIPMCLAEKATWTGKTPNQYSYNHTKACTAAMTLAVNHDCLPKGSKSLKQKKQTKTIHVSQFKREQAIIVSPHFYLSSSLELKTREIRGSTCSSRGQRQ